MWTAAIVDRSQVISITFHNLQQLRTREQRMRSAATAPLHTDYAKLTCNPATRILTTTVIVRIVDVLKLHVGYVCGSPDITTVI